MKVFEAVCTLLAVREFQDKPVAPGAACRRARRCRPSMSTATTTKCSS
jgi:hypothetical protein